MTVVKVSARNVGVARAAGLREVLRSRPARGRFRQAPEPSPAGPDAGLWLATTDADSLGAARRLSRQLRYADAGGEAVAGTGPTGDRLDRARRAHCGPVRPPVRDVAGPAPARARREPRLYRGRVPAAGGFPPLRTGEYCALVATLRAQGRRVLRTPLVTVVTSARATYRAPACFGHHLTTLGGGTGSPPDVS